MGRALRSAYYKLTKTVQKTDKKFASNLRTAYMWLTRELLIARLKLSNDKLAALVDNAKLNYLTQLNLI